MRSTIGTVSSRRVCRADRRSVRVPELAMTARDARYMDQGKSGERSSLYRFPKIPVMPLGMDGIELSPEAVDNLVRNSCMNRLVPGGGPGVLKKWALRWRAGLLSSSGPAGPSG